ncbi:hypothetical protein SynSYN20_01582 [Synechococcus sp. SYN20]|uniref:hypothetical protein n=1 Tax=Synechococcus sp. SYN20 TaxID=1050714 RepID=UPI001648D19D|nr:hypothetical protein [Synechococcus sp. SYN20]QNJ25909.1 hypothetical protein SynSYN20_01582 [Synechococcus sp. SYN20]
MAASSNHLKRLHSLLQSGLYATKGLAFDALALEFPEVMDGYGTPMSAEQNTLAKYRKAYPEEFTPRPGAGGERDDPDYLDQLFLDSIAEEVEHPPSPVAEWTLEEKLDAADLEIQVQNVRLAKQLQGQRDKNRIEAKSFREHARVENAIEAYARELTAAAKVMQEYMPDYTVRTGPHDSDSAVGLVHLSDLHFNELIDQVDNHYDFEIAAKRLQKLASVVKLQAKVFGIEKIVICFGGDLLNSDRRLDELLSMSTNRARATILAVHILRQFVMDLREEFFVDCFGITGNEGRAKQELGWGDLAVTDNYDAMIYDILGFVMAGDRGLRFHSLKGNEQVFQVHQETILLIHGHQVNADDQKKVQAIIGQKSASIGQRITHILCGHIHASRIGDYISRNASLAGANAYSGQALQLASKAAQNFHVVDAAHGGSMFGLKVDLQNVVGIEGYHIIEELEAYNAKSHDKAHRSTHQIQPIVVVI